MATGSICGLPYEVRKECAAAAATAPHSGDSIHQSMALSPNFLIVPIAVSGSMSSGRGDNQHSRLRADRSQRMPRYDRERLASSDASRRTDARCAAWRRRQQNVQSSTAGGLRARDFDGARLQPTSIRHRRHAGRVSGQLACQVQYSRQIQISFRFYLFIVHLSWPILSV